jgi:hypothetical protein
MYRDSDTAGNKLLFANHNINTALSRPKHVIGREYINCGWSEKEGRQTTVSISIARLDVKILWPNLIIHPICVSEEGSSFLAESGDIYYACEKVRLCLDVKRFPARVRRVRCSFCRRQSGVRRSFVFVHLNDCGTRFNRKFQRSELIISFFI